MSTNSKNINVEHIAKLAAIELTEKEKDLFQSQLEQVLSYIHQLNEVDVSNVYDDDVIPLNLSDLRNDEVSESISQEYVKNNAPLFKNDHISVPKILD
mgnify:CR=1 FL=1|jgi:aspartyl-tRNA(Asn)/glutamyl-tRNA(Gln) amidotransferase subunit C|tara:strand:- start:653 stop:946 length:294 start_codon:yes stop_codon:yes gene_type:complete